MECKRGSLKSDIDSLKTDPRLQDLGRSAKDGIQEAMRGLSKERVREVTAALGTKFATYGPRFKASFANAFAHTRGEIVPRLTRLVDTYGPRIRRTMTDPEMWDKAVAGFAVALDVHHRVEVMKDQALAQTLDTVGNRLTFRFRGRETTFNQWAGQAIEEKFPYLSNSTISEEPIQAFVYTFVATDTRYLLNELKLIKDSSGNCISATEAIGRASGKNADAILGGLEVAEKTLALRRGLATGEDLIPSASRFARMVRENSKE